MTRIWILIYLPYPSLTYLLLGERISDITFLPYKDNVNTRTGLDLTINHVKNIKQTPSHFFMCVHGPQTFHKQSRHLKKTQLNQEPKDR